MNFKTATDFLGLPASELAEACGLQPQTNRQMRLAPGSASFRSPPEGWHKVIARLAKDRRKELQKLVEAMESNQ